MAALRETEALLREAIATGEILTIAYHGGSQPASQPASQPGGKRQIAPIRIENDLVRARCYMSGKAKAFRIKKIQIFENDILISRWNPEEASTPVSTYANLSDVLKGHEADLLSLGWHVVAGDESISLFRKFKNGKLLKHPDAVIQFLETIEDGYYDLELNYHSEVKKRARPWVISLRQGGTAFGRLDRAVERFKLEALKHAPS